MALDAWPPSARPSSSRLRCPTSPSLTEFTKAQIKEMIEHQRTKYGWHFTFLGANQDAFAEAGAMGMQASASANFSMDQVGSALHMASRKVSRMRSQHRKGEEVRDEFTDEERKKTS